MDATEASMQNDRTKSVGGWYFYQSLGKDHEYLGILLNCFSPFRGDERALRGEVEEFMGRQLPTGSESVIGHILYVPPGQYVADSTVFTPASQRPHFSVELVPSCIQCEGP